MTKYSKKVLFRADDLGYSEAVNYGIEKAVKEGLIRSVGVMVNMPTTAHGVELLKNEPIAFSQHTNICVGKPLADPEKSLLWSMRKAILNPLKCIERRLKISLFFRRLC